MKVLVYCLQSTRNITKQDIENVSLNFDLLKDMIPEDLLKKVYKDFPKFVFGSKDQYVIDEVLKMLRKIYVDFLRNKKDYVIIHHITYESMDEFYTAVFEIAVIILCKVFDYKLIAKSCIFI